MYFKPTLCCHRHAYMPTSASVVNCHPLYCTPVRGAASLCLGVQYLGGLGDVVPSGVQELSLGRRSGVQIVPLLKECYFSLSKV